MRDYDSREMRRELEIAHKKQGAEIYKAMLTREIRKLYKPMIPLGEKMAYETYEDLVYMKALKDVEKILEGKG